MDARKIMMLKKKVFDIFQDDPFVNEKKKNWGMNRVDTRESTGFKYKGGHIRLGQGIKVLSIRGGAVCACLSSLCRLLGPPAYAKGAGRAGGAAR